MNRLVNANISKRLGAFLLDAFMVIILGTLLYSGFAQIFIRTPAFSEATKIMNEILVETHLYEYDEKDYLIEENISDNKYKINYSYSTDSFKQLNVISYYLSNNQIAANYTYEKNTVNGIYRIVFVRESKLNKLKMK